jgi:hypothetical protein
MRKSNFALRLQPSLLAEARSVAEAEGVALNQFINIAVAEKLSALRTTQYFAERAARADLPKALRILRRAGVGNPPEPGDEWSEKRETTVAQEAPGNGKARRRNATVATRRPRAAAPRKLRKG